MKYPIKVENCISADGTPLELLPPSQVVIDASKLLEPGSRVLDVGAYNGINGFYLAGLGHRVDSVELNAEYIYDASVLAKVIGQAAAGNNFINADFRNYTPNSNYDAAIATKVLPYMSEAEAHQSLDKIKGAVRPSGLNVVSVYIGEFEDKEATSVTLFAPGELEELYKAGGWKIVSYKERMKPLKRVFNPHTGNHEVRISSSADMIARKAAAVSLKQQYLSRAAAIEKLQPEQAVHLRRLAEDMPAG